MRRPSLSRCHRHALRPCARALGVTVLLGATFGCSADDAFDDDEIGAAGESATGSTGGSSAGGTRGSSDPGGSSNAGSSSAGSSNAGSSSAGGASSSAGAGGSPAGDEDDPGAGETGIFVGITAAHNETREALGLPDLTWSPAIADFAQQWADDLADDQCGSIAHRDQRQYGENIAMSGSTREGDLFSPEDAVAGWVAEVACWDFGTINGTESCDTQCVQGLSSNGCGHYTQVVWRNTQRVGCGYATCFSEPFNFQVWVCNYDPPGNFIGQAPY